MNLPGIKSSDKITRQTLTTFSGLNHRLGAGNGTLWDMRNLTSDEYPLLAVRPYRYTVAELTKPNGIYAHDGWAWVDGTGFYFNGVLKGTVEDSRKTFAGIGSYIIILPDKKYYDVDRDEMGSIEAKWSGERISFESGTIYDVPAEANTIQALGVEWDDYFKVGDAVTITGCTKIESNNKTPIVREIDGDKLRFYENTFTLDGTEGLTDYVELGDIHIERKMPDLDFIFENENRLWGCKDNEIFVSKLGDIFNWNVFDGLTTDSYNINVGTAGKFTAAYAYGSYSIFVKPDMIYKMYGNYPSNYQLMGSSTLGILPDSGKSVAIAGNTMFYYSKTGFCAYTGGVPSSMASVFGNEKLANVVAGTSGLKYYATAMNEEGVYRLYVYDTQTGIWHIEDETEAIGFASQNGITYMLTTDGKIRTVGKVNEVEDGWTKEPQIKWYAEFGDFTQRSGSSNRSSVEESFTKSLVKLLVRCELEKNATAEIWIEYDSSGRWQRVAQAMGVSNKKSYILPIIPQRCDHYRLKVTGKGRAFIYSISTEYSVGSEYRTTRL